MSSNVNQCQGSMSSQAMSMIQAMQCQEIPIMVNQCQPRSSNVNPGEAMSINVKQCQSR